MSIFPAQVLSQRQGLVVTSQLQQAIHLLNMSNAELGAFLENEAAENPFLDAKVGEAAHRDGHREAPQPAPALPSGAAARRGDDIDRIALFAEAQGPSLYAHVQEAIAAMFADPAEHALADAFLDALEPSGWLGEPLEMIAARTGAGLARAEAMLARLQSIEPAGLFARSLAECLRLQARAEGALCPAMDCVLDRLDLLAAGNLDQIARAAGLKMDALMPVLRRLRRFNPKPGTAFDGAQDPQRAPDLIVSRGAGGWTVDLNRSNLPTVVVAEDDAKSLSKRAKTLKDTVDGWVNERIAEARWLRRAVEHRNVTTLKIGAEVVRRQSEFLARGPLFLRPLTLREVADEVGVHESTVSRVTSGVMISTPQGTFRMKSLFSAALTSAGDDAAGSGAAVRHRIRQLIEAEPGDAPLSDDQIAGIISEEGTHLARRTVAKYREQLRIPSSFQRRRAARIAGKLGTRA